MEKRARVQGEDSGASSERGAAGGSENVPFSRAVYLAHVGQPGDEGSYDTATVDDALARLQLSNLKRTDAR